MTYLLCKRQSNILFLRNDKKHILRFQKRVFSLGILQLGYSLSRNEFMKKYISTEEDAKYFSNLREILTSNIYLLNKQRRIEKYINVFLLSKDEKQYMLNPFWCTRITEVFSSESVSFSEIFIETLNLNIKRNLFKPLSHENFFSSHEMFTLMIFTYLEQTHNFSSDVKQSSLISSVVINYKKFFSYRLELYFFIIYINSNYPNSHLSFDYFSDNLVFTDNQLTKHYKYKFLSILKKELKLNLTLNSKLFISEMKRFKEYFEGLTEDIHRYLYKVVFQAYHICIDLCLFTKFRVNKHGKSYDYSEAFNLDKFTKLSTMCYISSQLPMIVPPLN